MRAPLTAAACAWLAAATPAAAAEAGRPAAAAAAAAPAPIPEEAPGGAVEAAEPAAPGSAPRPGAAPDGGSDGPALDAAETAATATATAAVPVRAGAESSAPWYDDLALNAFVSAALGHNLGNPSPRPGVNIGRLFDRDNDSLKIDVATLALQDEPEALGELGFRLDVAHGLSVPLLVGGQDLGLLQGYVAALLPLGDGLRVDVGTFMGHIGLESIESFDDYNDTYSRGLLFTLGQPPLLTGVRATLAPVAGLGVALLAVNGWHANALDNNLGKTFGLQLRWAPTPPLGVALHALAGPENADDSSTWRALADLEAAWKMPGLTLAAELMAGRDGQRQAPAAIWLGAALSLRWDVVGPLVLGARGEYFDDADGFAGLSARLWEGTVDLGLRCGDSGMLRLEGRHDQALEGRTPFLGRGSAAAGQTTVALNLLVVF